MRVLAAAILLGVCASAHAQTMTPDQKREFRRVIELDLKEEFDKGWAWFQKSSEGRGTPQQLQMALSGFKTIFYNKAYNQYRCGLQHMPFIEKYSACVVERNRPVLVNYQMTTDYYSTVNPRSSKCELQARLFEAELEFPAFSFLEGSQLFDFTKLNDCLRK